MGRNFTQAKQELLDLKAELAVLLPDAAPELDGCVHNLINNRFEVAVVGQIKAGKSTLINALLDRPDFLPVDVVPWTSAITCLTLNGESDAEKGSATFKFLTKEQWRALERRQTIGDRLRSAAGRVGTAVRVAEPSPQEHGELDRAREKVVQQARLKHGKDLENLLDKKRTLRPYSEEDLKQYLCAGDDAHPGKPIAKVGLYAEITAEAEVHMESKDFPYAVSLVDTPGTNDPFELRSERTTDYLNRADAFIIVLNGTAAFTAEDKRFTDTLLGLNKSKQIFVVTRLDYQRPIASERDRIVSNCSRLLRDYCGVEAAKIQMVSGFWANTRRDKRKRRDFARNSDIQEFVVGANLASTDEVDKWDQDSDTSAIAIEAAMLHASGIPELRTRIATELLRHKGISVLESAKDNLRTASVRARQELQQAERRLREDVGRAEARIPVAEREISDLQRSIAEFSRNVTLLRRDIDNSSERLRKMPAAAASSVRIRVARVVDTHAVKIAQQLDGIGAGGERYFEADVRTLRKALAKELKVAFASELGGVNSSIERYFNDARNLALPLNAAGSDGELVLARKPGIDSSPCFAELGRPVVVDLGNWWSRLWAGSGTIEEKRAELRDQTSMAFQPVVSALTEHAEAEFQQVVSEAIAVVDRGVEAAIASLGAERKAALARLEELKSDDSPAKRAEIASAWRTEADAKRRLQDQIEVVEQKLIGYKLPVVGG